MRTEFSNEPYKVLNRDMIKYIAMFTMLLNHIATIFLTPGTWVFELFIAIGYFPAFICSCTFAIIPASFKVE